jgi:hypothetical protein
MKFAPIPLLVVRQNSNEGLKGVKQPATGLFHAFQLSAVGPLACLLLTAIPAFSSRAADTAKANPAPAADTVAAITLFNGLEYQGIVQIASTPENLTLLTIYGPLSFRRTDIIRTRTELTGSEQAAIRVALRDADAHRRITLDRMDRTDRAPDAVPHTVAGARAVREAREPAAVSPERIQAAQLYGSLDWAERLDRQLSKKLTLELSGDSLTDAIALITSITGATIIVSPKVQQANPPVTLRVTDMDAATALRWITKLTDTYAEITDHAIFITDKPSKESDDAEKTEIIMMAATVGAQVDLPADGSPLTDDDRMRIAKQIAEKEMPKVQDFPGPEMGIGDKSAQNPFGK